MTRNALVIRVGRVLQWLITPLYMLDCLIVEFVRLFGIKNEVKVICLLAPPRSGSTLTYQLLTTAFRNIHLTNFGNLFYSSPYLVSIINRILNRNYKSSFVSNYGFVKGLNGEAEGLKFWNFWIGQGLNESSSKWKSTKAKRLAKAINLASKKNDIYITGYIGHVFCIQNLRKLFPNIIFVHLKRDLLSNAYSIYRADPKDWFSTKPIIKDINEIDRFEQIAKQLIQIHSKMFCDNENDIIEINFEELVTNPMVELVKVQKFAFDQMGQISKFKSEEFLTALKFNSSKTSKDLNEDTSQLFHALKKEIDLISESKLQEKFKQILAND